MSDGGVRLYLYINGYYDFFAEKSYVYPYGALTRTVGKTFSSLRYGDTDLVSVTLCVLLCAGTESR